MTIVTVTPRAAASAVTASICVLLPSTRTTHSRLCCGSRRSASSKAAAMTAGISSVTEAVSHLPLACGSLAFGFAACAFSRSFCAGELTHLPCAPAQPASSPSTPASGQAG